VIIFNRLYDFLCFWYVHSKKFPKYDRYTIAKDIFNLLLEILIQIKRAEVTGQTYKINQLVEASKKLDAIKILIRLTNTLQLVDDKKYITTEDELIQIGKMIGGWIKSLNTNTRTP